MKQVLSKHVLLSEEKAVLRRALKERLALVPAERFAEAGMAAAALLPLTQAWLSAETLLLFMSMEREIDTLPLINAAFADNKKVFIPRVEGGPGRNRKKISFYRIEARGLTQNKGWSRGAFGIREPLPENPLLPTDFPALIMTPGLAFDNAGNRLGYGGGFYDRFFAEIAGRGFKALGLCVKEQIVPAVPAEKRDTQMNAVYGF